MNQMEIIGHEMSKSLNLPFSLIWLISESISFMYLLILCSPWIHTIKRIFLWMRYTINVDRRPIKAWCIKKWFWWRLSCLQFTICLGHFSHSKINQIYSMYIIHIDEITLKTIGFICELREYMAQVWSI